MPVIVIGADTPQGQVIVPALQPESGELRVFVSDPVAAEQFRRIAKVAVGDVSDGTHVGGAAIGAFCAVAIAAAAHDARERAFATGPASVLEQWAYGLNDAGIQRIIVVARPEELPQPNPLRTTAPEYYFVDASTNSPAEVATIVAEAESVASSERG